MKHYEYAAANKNIKLRITETLGELSRMKLVDW